MIKQLFLCFIFLAVILCGCTSTQDASTQASTQLQNPTNQHIPEDLHALSDEELIQKIVSTRALEAWAFQSTFPPTSEEGMSALYSFSEEFAVLMNRPTGLDSLKVYGPKIAAEYASKENALEALQGRCLGSLLVIYFPELSGTVDTLS